MLAQFLAKNFTWIQFGIIALVLVLLFRRWVTDDSKSQFKVREADRNLKFDRGPGAKTTAKDTQARPLQLTGARVEGAPHEILGIGAMASEDEIQKAYRELMKRYHPDKMGPPGSREWKDTQIIAEALNRARTEMLARLKRRS